MVSHDSASSNHTLDLCFPVSFFGSIMKRSRIKYAFALISGAILDFETTAWTKWPAHMDYKFCPTLAKHRLYLVYSSSNLMSSTQSRIAASSSSYFYLSANVRLCFVKGVVVVVMFVAAKKFTGWWSGFWSK